MICKVCVLEYDKLKVCRACDTTGVCFSCHVGANCCLVKGNFDRLSEDNTGHPDYCVDCGGAKKHIQQHLNVLNLFGLDCSREIEIYTKKLRLLK